MCIATLVVWGLAVACLEMRLDFATGHGRYLEIATFVGAAEVIVTHSYETSPCIIQRYQRANPNAAGWYEAEYARDYSPPKRVQFSSRWVDFEGKYPPVFRWFGFSQAVTPERYAYKCIELPYWAVVLLFAILPVSWRVRQVRLSRKTRPHSAVPAQLNS